MYIPLMRGKCGLVKNCIYEKPYVVTGDVKFTGLKETPKEICTDRIIGTGKA